MLSYHGLDAYFMKDVALRKKTKTSRIWWRGFRWRTL